MKLQPLLNEYLMENGNLPLVGAGRLFINHVSAALKDDNTLLAPPTYKVVFTTGLPIQEEQQNLTKFISRRLGTSAEQAAMSLKKEGELSAAFAEHTDTFEWPELGRFEKQKDGTILFSQQDVLNAYLSVIPLAAIKRQPVIKPVVVEAETIEIPEEPVYEMEEPSPKDNWWVWTVVIAAVSITLILIRFYL